MTDVTIPSVYPSVTLCYCVKTAKRIVEILHRIIVPSFQHSNGFTPRVETSDTEGYENYVIFAQQVAAVSQNR